MTVIILSIIGPDGVGKTTQITKIIHEYNIKRIILNYLWLRFFHFFSLPLLAYARIMGYSWVEELPDGKKIGYHNFSASILLKTLYPLFLLIDSFLYILFKLYIPTWLSRKNFICDRFVYDTIVDLMVAFNDESILSTFVGRSFLSLVPKSMKTILLLCNEGELRIRRSDVLFDKKLDKKIEYYNIIADLLNIPKINAAQSSDYITKEIMTFLTSN